MPKVSATPTHVKPFAFHGLDLSPVSEDQYLGECPFCGKAKFYCSESTGLWDCKVCGDSGNPLSFVRKLWNESDKMTPDTGDLAASRGLLYPETPMLWGAAKSITTGEIIIPGYGSDGQIHQLYKWSGREGKRILYPTPGVSNGATDKVGMFGIHLFDPTRETVYVCEGPWDGMALWEALRIAKRSMDGSGLNLTGAESTSLLATSNVISIPGANSFLPSWAVLLKGKHVILCFDNDHPMTNPKTGADIGSPAFIGMRKLAALLLGLSEGEGPASISYIRWGEDGDGWNLSWKNKGDVRDFLTEAGDTPSERIKGLSALLALVKPIPSAWEQVKVKARRGVSADMESLDCRSWDKLISAWRKPMKWRQEMDDVFSVMMAVGISTVQIGDQLFLQTIGDAGSGKTRLCDGMLVSKHCHALEHLTGFHSGWKGDDGEDYSLIGRINRKTLITPEGDVLISNPAFAEIMSQQRRIFDGTSGSSYKNRKEDTRHTGLRTPWIIAGTPALVNTDQSRLGDRFIRVYIQQPGEDEKEDILDRVFHSAIRSVKVSSNGSTETSMDPAMAVAYRMTGGYVDYLRDNAERLLGAIEVDDEVVRPYCKTIAKFVALMRARPELTGGKNADREAAATVEMPTRLTHQFSRLAVCMAAVLNKREVDSEVLRRVRKVALDTAHGRVLEFIHRISREGYGGADTKSISLDTGVEESKVRHFMMFLRSVGALDKFVEEGKTRVRWRLSPSTRDLYEKVMTYA